MTRDPYQPPQKDDHVEMELPPVARGRVVALALCCFVVAAHVVGLFRTGGTWAQWGSFSLYGLTLVFFYQGKRWARGVLGALFTFAAFGAAQTSTGSVQDIAWVTGFGVAAAVTAFSRDLWKFLAAQRGES